MAFDPRGFRGYLFDLDGTLIDTAPDICAAVNHALEQFGYGPAPESMVRHWVGYGGKACIEQAVAAADAQAAGASPSQNRPAAVDGHTPGIRQPEESPATSLPAVDPTLVDAMLEPFLDHYGAHIADMSRPYPHAVATLRILSERRAKLAVVTNKRIELTSKLLDALELTPWFDVIVGGDTAANPKPAPDPIFHACHEVGLSPQEILFVGDSETDVNASRAAGCRVVCVPDGYNHGIAPERLGADAIIGSLAELV